MEEKIKPIVLHDTENGQDYTLEFTRDTVRWAESRGFKMNEISDYPMTRVYELFYYSFRAHHKNVARDKTDRIIDEAWGGIAGIPEGVIERLGELYAAPFNALAEASGNGKNGKVTVEL